MQKKIPVVCGIIEHNGRILAAKRNARQTNAGLWEFPGGKVNDGELPSDALKREMSEELGISIYVRNQLVSVDYKYPWIAINLIPFVCAIREGAPFPHEHEEVRFFALEELNQLNWAPADLLVIDIYNKFKNG